MNEVLYVAFVINKTQQKITPSFCGYDLEETEGKAREKYPGQPCRAFALADPRFPDRFSWWLADEGGLVMTEIKNALLDLMGILVKILNTPTGKLGKIQDCPLPSAKKTL